MTKKEFLSADELLNLHKGANDKETAKSLANAYSDLLREVVDEQKLLDEVNNNLIALVEKNRK